MTTSATPPREQYATDGITVAFTIHFQFFADTDVNAVFVDSGGMTTTLALSTDFSVIGGNGAGGTLTTGSAQAAGGILTIFREIDFAQESDYVEDDPFPPDTVEHDFDRAAMRDQQLQDAVGRALTFPVTVDPAVSAVLPLPAAGQVLGWNGTGDALENKNLPNGTAVYSSTATIDAGATANEAVTPKGLHDSVFNPNGKHLIPIDAAAMRPALTNGAALTVAEESTSKHNYAGLSYSNSTQQFACFDLCWPKSANESTVNFQVECRHASGSGNVEFALEAVGVGDGDDEDVTYGTAISVIVALSTTGKRHISTASAALTIKNLAEGDTVKWRMKRVITTSGNIAQPVVVEKVRVFITTSAGTDA